MLPAFHGEKMERLSDLMTAVAVEQAASWPRDPRGFRAHLTLARADGVRAGPETLRRLVEEAATLRVEWQADELVLFESVTGGGPVWSTETVSTYVYKRAFEWNTFDLGYPSAIAVLWFVIILAFVAIVTRALRQRDRLEF